MAGWDALLATVQMPGGSGDFTTANTITVADGRLVAGVTENDSALGGADVVVDGVAETRSVTTGLITATQVEIVSGVSAGEQVVIGEVTP